jgi:hypothetical protein
VDLVGGSGATAAYRLLQANYTLTSVTTAQKLFNWSTNGALTLAAGTYRFTCSQLITSMSTTSGSAKFDLKGAGFAVFGKMSMQDFGSGCRWHYRHLRASRRAGRQLVLTFLPSPTEKKPIVANQNDFWSSIMTDQAKTTLAGAAGGIVRWVTLRERWQDGVASLLVGSICALYAMISSGYPGQSGSDLPEWLRFAHLCHRAPRSSLTAPAIKLSLHTKGQGLKANLPRPRSHKARRFQVPLRIPRMHAGSTN